MSDEMAKTYRQRIRESRLLHMNQYALLDDTGGYSALIDGKRVEVPSADRIAESRRLLQDPYAHLNEFGDFSAADDSKHIQPDVSRVLPQLVEERYASLLRNKRENHRYSGAEIEAKAIDLQRYIWQDRRQIWLDAVPPNPIDMLDPAIAFKLIDFDYDLDESLGYFNSDGRQIEVAGIIDDSIKQVRISRRFPNEVRNFTAAHELGHALLHDARGLHRDRSLDGTRTSREPIEFEADKFASYFLMPEKLVKASFKMYFGTDNFVLNEGTSFALNRDRSLELRRNCSTPRDLSRILAAADSYNGVRFFSLASQFRVSMEAMAIRIEELGLVSM
jgi:hypothetical protein